MTSKIAAGVEKFTDASVTVFQDVGGKIFPYKQFSFQSADGITSFTPSSIQTTPGSSIFQYDQTNYVLKNTILTVDAFGNPVETIGRDKRSAAVVQGYGGTLPVLALSNARLQEVAYSDFETTTSVDFASWSGPTFSVGRTGAKAINIGVGGTFKLTRTITKNQSVNYIFSCWVKAGTAGSLTIKAKNGSTDLITPVSLPFSVSASWKYYRVSIPASSLPASFTTEITSSVATILDDVAFYPDHADFITYTYMLPYGKASETDTRGTSLFYMYDEWGRVKAVYDREYNVVKKYDYHTRP